jgi:predicted dehydrogenase
VESVNKPRLAIIGLGRYYRKLKVGIQQHFIPVLKADAAEVEGEGGVLKPLVLRSKPDAIMLLTPNQLHASQILELAELGLPVFVEKPLATTREDLDAIVRSLQLNPLLYCSDFYLDVRAAPLLAWFGRPFPECLRKWISIAQDEQKLWQQGPSVLPSTRGVDAVLLEGEGQAGSFEGREWLWDPVHGGVLWDLAYHFVVLAYSLFQEPLAVVSSDLRSFGTSRIDPAAETYAALELQSASGTRFHFRVGKYHENGNDRWLRITGTQGEISMTFADPNVLRITLDSNECVAVLRGSYYAHVSEVFCEYVVSGPSKPHGLEPAIEAVRLIADLKQRTCKARTL